MGLRQKAKSAVVDMRKMLRMFRALDREAIAAHFIRGSGIEVGGLHNPLRVATGVKVRYIDRMPADELRTQYPELAKRVLAPVDIVDDGETLSTIGDATQDFVIANHFLEHCENPLGALLAHQRVLKPGGIHFLCVPDKRYTFDMRRRITPYDHVIKDFREGPVWSRRGHVLDWVEHVENIHDPAKREQRADQLQAEGYSIHYHVWTFEGVVDMLLRAKTDVGFSLEFESFLLSEGEIVIVLRRRQA
jgi:predicted SAM-dependent methyltransferase